MTRLHRLLLAGTFVPALLLSTSAFAQAPDQGEHRQKRERADQGGGTKGEAHHDKQGERAGNGRQGAPRDAGSAGPRPDRRNADAGAPGAPPRGDDMKREKRQMQGETAPAGKGMPPQRAPMHDAATPPDNGRPGPGRPEQRIGGNPDQRLRAGDRDRGPDAGPRDDTRPGRGGPDQRMGGTPDQRQRAGDRDRGPDAGPRDDARRPDTPGPGPDRRFGNDNRRPGPGIAVGVGAAAVGAAAVGAGFAGGFLAPTDAHRMDDLRRDRREVRDGDRTFIREPGRTIVQENGRAFIVHDENDRFRALGLDVRRERRGNDFVDSVRRPNGDIILTFTDGTGRLLRRVRRDPGGREVVLIDNGIGGRIGAYQDDVIDLPPPPIRIPRDRYIVDYRNADAGLIYETLIAPPLVALPRRYTLDQIRYSPDIRSYIRSVDIDTINFATASWEVPPEAGGKLQALATAINRAIDRNPNAVFLVEGFTDAVGNADDNLSLSDRRAQSVAEILTKDFNVPPENLTTQGYGEQNLREQTDGPSAVNRRVVVQNITPLLASGGAVSGQ